MKKTTIALVLIFALTSSLLSAAAFDYSDIKGHWAEDTVNGNGFTEIFGESGAFLPNKAVTRMEFARILHKALDIKIMYFKATDIKEFFSDVSNEDAGASALYDLVISNIIPKSGVFRPNEPLRRDEMISWLMNGLKYKTNGEYSLIKMMPAPFDDDGKITAAYKNDVVEAVLLKIISGRGNNMLYPDTAATRAEAVTAISRLLNVIKSLADVKVTTDASMSDDSIEMKLSITNNTDKAIEIQHTSGQKYDFDLLGADGNSLYRWSADKMFILSMSTTVIEPGDTAKFTEILTGDVYNGIKNKISMMKAYIVGTSDSFSINPDGYEYRIK
jgi:hypothetical protein